MYDYYLILCKWICKYAFLYFLGLCSSTVQGLHNRTEHANRSYLQLGELFSSMVEPNDLVESILPLP